ncbi:hypothetical protein QE374_000082 [Microbacterium sp. SORGH_AS428]|uniref:DUF4349 domain-containing protein n=1 Tax=Microbacterium sp. SORGH_AS_0428 TaxID=3041788 RepID=UPI0028600079|nr:DUF4349 domain-containing protein [Microbacterium sp. SORGH_AS_0428]MDR6198173.1 hypothetical protein [Microbacterium sp. SORGH_AS_0428]
MTIDDREQRQDLSLPEGPSAEQVDRIERGIERDLAFDRMRRRARRRGGWAVAAAGVAVVALAAVVSPVVLGGRGPEMTNPVSLSDAPVTEQAETGPLVVQGAAGSADASRSGATDAGREVSASGWLQMTVDDPAAAQQQITAIVTGAQGYVSSASIAGAPTTTDPAYPAPPQSSITVRVPAERLQDVIDQVGALGTVSASSVDRFDVTDQAVDLRARIAAQETSVSRLTELLAQSASVADLIAAESALADRQAALDADRQQLEMLEDQVAMSTLTVTLAPKDAAPHADPAGFGDGIAAGWAGLVATVNGIVIGLGFLLPWLAVIAVAVVIVWAMRRLRRAQRLRRSRDAAPAPESPADAHEPR